MFANATNRSKSLIVPPNGSPASKEILYVVFPKCDIEKNCSKVHDRLHVSRATSVDAHGVAIVNSCLDDEFHHRRGDKFLDLRSTKHRTVQNYECSFRHQSKGIQKRNYCSGASLLVSKGSRAE